MSCTRCFGTQSCSCQIIAGDNITVDGSGTPADPFVIAGQAGGVGADNDTTNASLSHDPLTGELAITDSAGGVVSVNLPVNVPTTLSSVDVADNGDGTSTITVTDSTGASVSDTYPTPDDIFVTGVTPAATPNPDGSTTTTFTVALSDGSSTDFAYDHTPSATPTSIALDPAAGTVVVTYTNPDGSTFSLTDTAPAFADTDTTNATFTLVGSVLTITDSAGGALDVTLPAGTVDTDTTNASLVHDPLTGVLTLTDSAGDSVTATIPVDVPTTLSSVDVADNGDGTSTITVTDSTGASVSDTYPTPDDVFVTGVTPATVVNPDGSSTTTFTVALSDGSSTDFTYDHTPSAIPTSIDIDPAAGSVTVTFTNPDGTTFDLVDTEAAFADTDTTNATLTIVGGVLTITDSAGASLDVTLPAGGSDVGEASVADNGNNTGTVNAVTAGGASTSGTFISELIKVTPDGTVGTIDPDVDCVPTGAFQRILDASGSIIDAECGVPVRIVQDGLNGAGSPIGTPSGIDVPRVNFYDDTIEIPQLKSSATNTGDDIEILAGQTGFFQSTAQITATFNKPTIVCGRAIQQLAFDSVARVQGESFAFFPIVYIDGNPSFSLGAGGLGEQRRTIEFAPTLADPNLGFGQYSASNSGQALVQPGTHTFEVYCRVNLNTVSSAARIYATSHGLHLWWV